MSISSGGRADKLGNRYEGLWVAHNLLRLLWEEVAAVQLEAVGDEEQGVDVWVTGGDGTRHAYQCKRKNGTVGRWSVADLARQDVLRNAAVQLRRDLSAHFTFVSTDAAPGLRELADTARGAGDDADEYFLLTLVASDYFIVPCSAEYLPMVGLQLLSDSITKMFKLAPNLRALGVVLTLYSHNERICRLVEGLLRAEIADNIFETRIRVNTKAKSAPSVQKTIFDYEKSAKGRGTEDFTKLAAEVLERLEARESR
jgi:hypothetical protein